MDLQRRTMFLFIASTIAVLGCSTGVQAGCCCPTFWTAFGSNCYRFFSYNKGWNGAEMFCQSFTVPSLGDGEAVRDSLGHLVSIHSQAEQNFVNSLFENSRKKDGTLSGLWLGLNDISSEGDFQWSDGSLVNFNSWLPGQPADTPSHEEDCGVIRIGGNGLWRDGPCEQETHGGNPVLYFICKLPMW